MDNKDYTLLTLEELLVEEKKVKKRETLSAFLIGLLAGVIVYSLVKNGFALIPIITAFVPLMVIYKSSQNQKQILQQIQAEINARKVD
jgi:hypothetical protein